MSDAPPEPGRLIHPIVDLDYRVRTAANVLLLAVMASVLAERHAPMWAWVLPIFQGLLWAPLARTLARRAADARRAEHRTLMGDALLCGAQSGVIAFGLWPTTLLLGAVLVSMLGVGGPSLAWRGVLAWLAGALTGATSGAFAVQLDTSLRTALLCATCFIAFLLMFGMNTFVQHRQAQQARREAIRRNEQSTLENRQLEMTRMLVESANRTKRAFLANMSHALHTPLNTIIGYSEMLEADAIDAGQSHKADELQKIRMAGTEVLAMVEDLLNFSRSESGQVELLNNVFRPADLVRESAKAARESIENNGNLFRVESSLGTLKVRGDAVKLGQVLSQLLSNAGRFTRAGEVVLAARYETDVEVLALVVSDTGIGIAPAQRAALFRAFAQTDATPRRFGGNGLGLAIAHHYCELMGGTLEVESEADAGARFTARVPATMVVEREVAHAAHPDC